MNTFILIYSLLILSILILSVRNIRVFFFNTVDGFSHYSKQLRYIIIPHIFILIVSIIYYKFFSIKFFDSSINLKKYLFLITSILSLSLFNYLSFCFVSPACT